MAAGRAAPLIAAESPDSVALSVRAAVPEVVMEPATRRRTRGPASKRWPALASRSPRGAAHPGNGVIAPFHGERPRNRGVKDTHRPPFSAPSSRRRPSETAIRTASPALTLKPSRPGTTNRSRLRDGVGRYESDRRGPGQGGRARLAQCEPGATQAASPRAVRAQRDTIHLSSIRASPPGAMRAQVTSPKRLPQGRVSAGLTGWDEAPAALPGDSPRGGAQTDGAADTAADDRIRPAAPPHGLAARTAPDRAGARRREAVALLREQHHYSASDTARALGVSRQRVYQLAR